LFPPVEDAAAVFAENELSSGKKLVQDLGPDAHVAEGAEIVLDRREGDSCLLAVYLEIQADLLRRYRRQEFFPSG
jgi:hypothetical protein